MAATGRHSTRAAGRGRTVQSSAMSGRFVVRQAAGRSPKATVGERSTGTDSSERTSPRAESKDLERVRVEAAKLRQITDRKLGKTTPTWVARLAGKRS